MHEYNVPFVRSCLNVNETKLFDALHAA